MFKERVRVLTEDERKRGRIKNYFFPPEENYKSLIIIGIISIILGIGIALVFGIVYLIIGLNRKKNFNANVVSDYEIDTLLRDDINKILQYIPNKINIDSSQLITEPIYSGYFPLLQIYDTMKYSLKFGKDKIFRYTPIKINAVLCTTDEFITFDLIFDFLKGNAIDQVSQAYYYKDIVSLATITQTLKLFDGNYTIKEGFVLYTSAGSSVSVELINKEFLNDELFRQVARRRAELESLEKGEYDFILPDYIPRTNSETTILALRKIIRDNKKMLR